MKRVKISVLSKSGRLHCRARLRTLHYLVVVFVFLFALTTSNAQDKDNIGTETVTVVKPYSPIVSDAFKIKTNPTINDSIALQKKPITYEIFSIPVASTFTPAKAKAARVEKIPSPTPYSNYAAVGLGNYNNALVDFYTSWDVNTNGITFNTGLTHFSSRGDIASTPLDTDFYNTNLDVSLNRRERDYNWSVGLGIGHQLYNWYGVEEDFFQTPPNVSITLPDVGQNYFNADVTGRLSIEESFFKNAKLLFRRFWDASESGENRATINTEFEVPITSELVNFKAKIDYVGGQFTNASLNNTATTAALNYGHLIAGLNPSFVILRDELTLQLGANFVYGNDLERSNGSFFIYPSITASYRVLEDQVIAYGGLEGDLHQNSYYDFVSENPFVSPTLALSIDNPLYGLYSIQPTDQQYNAYAGIKGQLSSNIGYNFRGFYRAENRKPLFLSNPQNTFRAQEVYSFGNSFQVFYDDVKTFGFFGGLNVNVNRNFTLGLNAEYFNYNTETNNPAWNLPELKGSLFLDYQIDDKWFAGINLFYVGERQDVRTVAAENTPPNQFVSTILTLDGFFDANAHLGYRFNEQLSVFAKVSNLTNNNYQRWANFRVQGFQALAGVSYKFDF